MSFTLLNVFSTLWENYRCGLLIETIGRALDIHDQPSLQITSNEDKFPFFFIKFKLYFRGELRDGVAYVR